MTRFPALCSARIALAWCLAVCFALQMVVARPLHAAHSAQERAALQIVSAADSSGQKIPTAEDCSCDLCIYAPALDLGSVAFPRQFTLDEWSFPPGALAFVSFSSSLLLRARARAPPAALSFS